MKIAIAAGGTAGHINPALALAEELLDRGHEVTFYGRPSKLEGTLVPAAGFELVDVEVTGFDRSKPWTAVSSLRRVWRAKASLKRRFAAQGAPDVAIGFGAYVEVPLLGFCKDKGIPYLIHEQNSVPGLANKMMAAHAARVCISVPAARPVFEREGDTSHVALTGNPVRRSVIAGDRSRGRAALGVPEDATLLLVFGGSLGARTLNEGMARLKGELLSIDGLHVVQSTGKGGYDDAAAALALTDDEEKRWDLRAYIDDMGDVLAAADLVLSRAGASSIAEIAAVGVPSVLVPYPYATADHQTTNAKFLVDAGAAVLFADDEVSQPVFGKKLVELLEQKGTRAAMRAAAKKLGQDSAASALADQVESCVRG
ncbi:undecaprenyldiphospho-muramoylpentapeptide beta-N-acetylglucosaminyltransferase [Paratractidigestivibacter sp.]|uniref:undecaprenyldiphospho-muramoylpentapeptide beta-N-acetylglucosaminyltransferase n=1 Tax=Paratractidigestivibacter sp. TaxID=2847316 RepID=UPI002ABD327C|nr:undecaprenyldiphospho-muramoylpentapeptide beta-N-acetylglucosaminyltransferase [Paratractidigestivibacter sp.]